MSDPCCLSLIISNKKPFLSYQILKELNSKKDDIIVSNDTRLSLNDKDNLKDEVLIVENNDKEDNTSTNIRLNNVEITDDIIKDRGKIASEIEEDIVNGNYIDTAKEIVNSKSKSFKKVRKGKKKYIISIDSTKDYDVLAKDIRSLYNKKEEIIEDVSKSSKRIKKEKKKKKVIEDDDETNGRKTLLDYISQKFLNIVILILSVIFVLLLIWVIGMIIYISTF